MENLELVKSQLTNQLSLALGVAINNRKLTRFAASKLTGIDSGRISKILNGQLYRVSSLYLIAALCKLDYDVEITIKPKKGNIADIQVFTENM